MEIKLKKLKLVNFKGIKEKDIEFTDHTNISGDNATGKSTIFDAYSWLLWGKDSLNRKDYEIKPYDEENNIIHNLESSVEGEFDIDGKEVIFTRVYKEVWTKKRGSNSETFTGNTTDFYINQVPMKKKDYEDKISELVSEDEFNLLSNPKYFNEILDKKDRRNILVSLVDDVEFEDLLKISDDFKDLDLENYSLDELRAMAKATCKKINDKIKEIPARIDELENTKTTDDFEELEKEKEEVNKAIEDMDRELAGTKNISEVLQDKYELISKYKKDIADIKNEFEDRKKEKIKENESIVQDLKRKISVGDFEIDNSKTRIDELEKLKTYAVKRCKEINIELKDLRKDYVQTHNERFDGSLTCPTCGKEFDLDKKQEIIKSFNLEKSKKLEKLNEEATLLKIGAKNIEESINKYNKEVSDLKLKLEKLQISKVEIEKELDLSIKKLEEIKDKEMGQELKDDVKALEDKIDEVEEEISKVGKADNTELLSRKDSYKEKLESINSKLSRQELNSELDIKISQYMEDEKRLSKEFEDKQRILYLCDEYTKAYTELVSEKVNDLFTFVKFKLFDTQINGGIVETAEATYKGVPYGSLNSAAQINAGLDVIKSLSKHFDKQIPIFVDNAESVNELAETNGQLITLTVSKFKNLRIENL